MRGADGAGHARVADMGLARQLTPGSAATLTGETGTYFYMAPEMIRHELYDSKADVYSWGVMFVEILTQRLPYEGQYLTPVQVGASGHVSRHWASSLRSMSYMLRA